MIYLFALATDSVNFIHLTPLFNTGTYIISIFFTSPVLAAAPDIKHLFPRIFPPNPPILPKNPRQLGQILQKTPLFYPKIIKNPTFYPLNP